MDSSNTDGHTLPRALTIAGFDPSGGAGVLADARTFIALGCSASAVITSITYQNSERVFGTLHQTAEAVREQIMPLLAGPFACVKTGMLPTREVVNEVARLLRETGMPSPVVDPVILSSSGQRLMDEEALKTLIEELLPLSRLVTPNIPEAERLGGIEIDSEAGMREAAVAIRGMGARAVLIKGGHLRGKDCVDESEEAVDVLDNGGEVTVFRHRRVPNVELHGTGCMLSAAIAAGLGRGRSLEDSVATAKQFVFEEIGRVADRCG